MKYGKQTVMAAMAAMALGWSMALGADGEAPKSAIEAFEAAKATGGAALEALPGELAARAEAGDANAWILLGQCHAQGLGTEKDTTAAFNCYLKAAKEGDAWGAYNAALCCRNGTGTRQNAKKATKWMKRAWERGLVNAAYSLASWTLPEVDPENPTGGHLEGRQTDEAARWALKGLARAFRNGDEDYWADVALRGGEGDDGARLDMLWWLWEGEGHYGAVGGMPQESDNSNIRFVLLVDLLARGALGEKDRRMLGLHYKEEFLAKWKPEREEEGAYTVRDYLRYKVQRGVWSLPDASWPGVYTQELRAGKERRALRGDGRAARELADLFERGGVDEPDIISEVLFRLLEYENYFDQTGHLEYRLGCLHELVKDGWDSTWWFASCADKGEAHAAAANDALLLKWLRGERVGRMENGKFRPVVPGDEEWAVVGEELRARAAAAHEAGQDDFFAPLLLCAKALREGDAAGAEGWMEKVDAEWGKAVREAWVAATGDWPGAMGEEMAAVLKSGENVDWTTVMTPYMRVGGVRALLGVDGVPDWDAATEHFLQAEEGGDAGSARLARQLLDCEWLGGHDSAKAAELEEKWGEAGDEAMAKAASIRAEDACLLRRDWAGAKAAAERWGEKAWNSLDHVLEYYGDRERAQKALATILGRPLNFVNVVACMDLYKGLQKSTFDLFLEAKEAGDAHLDALPVVLEARGEAGEAEAWNWLGQCYRQGLGVEADDAESLRFYLKGAAEGDDWGAANAGWNYRNGIGTEPDAAAAMAWTETAWERGIDAAAFRLGAWMAADEWSEHPDAADVDAGVTDAAARWVLKGLERTARRRGDEYLAGLASRGEAGDDGARLEMLWRVLAGQGEPAAGTDSLESVQFPLLLDLLSRKALGAEDFAMLGIIWNNEFLAKWNPPETDAGDYTVGDFKRYLVRFGLLPLSGAAWPDTYSVELREAKERMARAGDTKAAGELADLWETGGVEDADRSKEETFRLLAVEDGDDSIAHSLYRLGCLRETAGDGRGAAAWFARCVAAGGDDAEGANKALLRKWLRGEAVCLPEGGREVCLDGPEDEGWTLAGEELAARVAEAPKEDRRGFFAALLLCAKAVKDGDAEGAKGWLEKWKAEAEEDTEHWLKMADAWEAALFGSGGEANGPEAGVRALLGLDGVPDWDGALEKFLEAEKEGDGVAAEYAYLLLSCDWWQGNDKAAAAALAEKWGAAGDEAMLQAAAGLALVYRMDWEGLRAAEAPWLEKSVDAEWRGKMQASVDIFEEFGRRLREGRAVALSQESVEEYSAIEKEFSQAVQEWEERYEKEEKSEIGGEGEGGEGEGFPGRGAEDAHDP